MTVFRVGDRVTCHREAPAKGSWWRYDGRKGWVATVNTQNLPCGPYVEIGVSWSWQADMVKMDADAWFLPTELVAG